MTTTNTTPTGPHADDPHARDLIAAAVDYLEAEDAAFQAKRRAHAAGFNGHLAGLREAAAQGGVEGIATALGLYLGIDTEAAEAIITANLED